MKKRKKKIEEEESVVKRKSIDRYVGRPNNYISHVTTALRICSSNIN